MKARTIYVDEVRWDKVRKMAKDKLGLSMSAYINLFLRTPVTVGDLEGEYHFHIGIMKDKNTKTPRSKKKSPK